MNIARAYHSLIKEDRTEKPDSNGEAVPKGEQDAVRAEVTHNWLQSSITQEMFKSLAKDEQACIDLAIRTACNVEKPNYNLIVQLLIRADTLRKLKQEYGSMK